MRNSFGIERNSHLSREEQGLARLLVKVLGADTSLQPPVLAPTSFMNIVARFARKCPDSARNVQKCITLVSLGRSASLGALLRGCASLVRSCRNASRSFRSFGPPLARIARSLVSLGRVRHYFSCRSLARLGRSRGVSSTLASLVRLFRSLGGGEVCARASLGRSVGKR